MRQESFKFLREPTFFIKDTFVFFFMILSQCLWCQQTICYGSTVNYNVDGTENLGLGTIGSIYNWTVQDVRFVGKFVYPYKDRTNFVSIAWGNTPPGNYILKVSEVNNGCEGLSKTLDVGILQSPAVNLIDQSICVDPITKQVLKTALLNTNLLNNDLYSFKWFFENKMLSIADNQIIANQVGNYSVEVSSLVTGCKTNKTVAVGSSSQSTAIVRVEDDFEDIQNIIITITNGIGDYEYSIDGFSFQDSSVFTVSKPGTYNVTIRDKKGCGDLNIAANVIVYPKFFTPNGDGYNDTWNIKGIFPLMNPIIDIFDRYGKLIAKINRNEPGWDGTYNGIRIPSDDYWFTVGYTNYEGKQSVFKSHFSLKR
jgi:gliding motility-associated-like protein